MYCQSRNVSNNVTTVNYQVSDLCVCSAGLPDTPTQGEWLCEVPALHFLTPSFYCLMELGLI